MIVIPAKAGTQPSFWAPAFAGATKVLAAVALALLLVAAPASAQNFPELTGRVVDQAGLLSPAQVVDLTSKSEALEAATKRQFVVATVDSLEGRTIEEYGYQLGRKWGIGDEQRDDGVILLVAPNEKKVRIETGYGARVFLTDAISGLIVQNTILPKFREGDLPGGIMAGADAIITQMQLPPEQAQANIAAAEQQQRKRASGIGAGIAGFVPVIIIMIIFFSIIGSLSRRGRGRRYRRRSHGIDPWIVLWGLNEISRASRGGRGGFGGWGGGGGGGGFGGFSGGGGSFGGGGASGGW